MTVSYEKNKKNIFRWRENNREQYQEIDREYKYKAYHFKKDHPEEHAFQKEARKFRNIFRNELF